MASGYTGLVLMVEVGAGHGAGYVVGPRPRSTLLKPVCKVDGVLEYAGGAPATVGRFGAVPSVGSGLWFSAGRGTLLTRPV